MTTPEAEAFYAARDVRTAQYGGLADALALPITLHVTTVAAASRSGQVAALSLVEMLTRVHRRLRILAPGAPVLCQTGSAGDFSEVLHATAAGIDPHQNTRREADAAELVVQVGLGLADPPPAVTTAWRGGRGEVHLQGVAPQEPSDLADQDNDDLAVLGAATAAILAAAAAFRLVHGDHPRPAALNLLERTADTEAGTASLPGPVDVGDILMIGAGAVAHGTTYWLREFDCTGLWRLVDADKAEIHNTGRCLGMTAADAGWPQGKQAGEPKLKVTSAAAMIRALTDPRWFHESEYTQKKRPDLILPLANEHGIRLDVAQLGEALLLHASTSQNWTAELHRHLAGQDDCPACRIPEQHETVLACSQGASRPQQTGSSDAALPFLSAAAGLLLTVALLDLSADATLLSGRVNHWRIHLELGATLWQKLPHLGTRCAHTLHPAVRTTLHTREPRRWDGTSD